MWEGYRRHTGPEFACYIGTFGGLSPALTSVLREAADWRSNKLTSSEYDETTWSARTWLTRSWPSGSPLRCSSPWRRRRRRRPNERPPRAVCERERAQLASERVPVVTQARGVCNGVCASVWVELRYV